MIKFFCEQCGQEDSGVYRDPEKNKCNYCKNELEKLGAERSQEYSNFKRVYDNSFLNIKSEIYYCSTHDVPHFDTKCNYCETQKLENSSSYLSTDLRPVFGEERLFLMTLLTLNKSNKDLIRRIESKSVWASSTHYYFDGKSLSVSKKKLQSYSPEMVRDEMEKLTPMLEQLEENAHLDHQKFIEVNANRYNRIEHEAMNFIESVSADYAENEMFISFSGGKDSTVVHDLVIRSLANKKVPRFFGDTTLEMPETYQYVERLKKETKHLPLFKPKNKKDDFFELSEVIGPPSRLMRWCCVYFKTGPISDRLDRAFKNTNKILSFQGIRRAESNNRNKYERESDSPKIAKQRVVSPIIDWLDFDVWLYILSRRVDFNDAYRKGFSRVGCWCCPNNSSWAEYLSAVFHPEDSARWNRVLINFAEKTNKSDPEEYVSGGNWKARQGGNGLEISNNGVVDYEPCVTEVNLFNYHLTREISDDLYELFKPFGRIDTDIGDKRLGEVYVLDSYDNPLIKLQGRKGRKNLKVTIISMEHIKKIYKRYPQITKGRVKSFIDIKQKVDCQITKYQTCLSCGGCSSACKYDAIKVTWKNRENTYKPEDTQYIIDESKCIHCLNCIDHFDNGCYLKKIIRVKIKE